MQRVIFVVIVLVCWCERSFSISNVATTLLDTCTSPCPTSCAYGFSKGTAWTLNGCTVYCQDQPMNGQCAVGGSGCTSSCAPAPTLASSWMKETYFTDSLCTQYAGETGWGLNSCYPSGTVVNPTSSFSMFTATENGDSFTFTESTYNTSDCSGATSTPPVVHSGHSNCLYASDYGAFVTHKVTEAASTSFSASGLLVTLVLIAFTCGAMFCLSTVNFSCFCRQFNPYSACGVGGTMMYLYMTYGGTVCYPAFYTLNNPYEYVYPISGASKYRDWSLSEYSSLVS
jgi:hypothetical protein